MSTKLNSKKGTAHRNVTGTGHSNTKAMNEARYFLCWLYLIDLHNLEVQGLVSSSDPRTEYRWSLFDIEEADLSSLKTPEARVDTLMFDKLKIHNETFTCKVCGCGFTAEGYLKSHMEKKHGEKKKLFECSECNKILSTKRTLEDHIKKIHRTCKICGSLFDNNEEMLLHKASHTTCTLCNTFFVSKSKLERHMLSHR